MRPFVLVLLAALVAGPLLAADELEELLVLKFAGQNQVEFQKLRAFFLESVNKTKELRDTDPERGIDLLREVSLRMDELKLLPAAERRAMMEVMQPIVVDLRNVSLTKRREKASSRLDVFRQYLDTTALESRYPGRSADGWEPALFWNTRGQGTTAKLIAVNLTFVRKKYQVQEESVLSPVVPVIQVFGGLYVYDRNTGYHVFVTNREFYDSVWSLYVKEWTADPLRKPLTAAEEVRPTNERKLQATIASGEYFMRGLPNLEPIPNVGFDEAPFLEFVAQGLMHKGMPRPIERIYPIEMQERLGGFSKIQLSATKRTLQILQLKDVTVSPLYAEILREEVTKVLKSEYNGFVESEVNRSIQYMFTKLK